VRTLFLARAHRAKRDEIDVRRGEAAEEMTAEVLRCGDERHVDDEMPADSESTRQSGPSRKSPAGCPLPMRRPGSGSFQMART